MANEEFTNGKGKPHAGEDAAAETPDTPEAEGETEAEKEAPDLAFSARLVRVVRTESSEVYIIWQDDVRLGQVDLHYGWDLIHATLLLEKDLTNEQQADLVDLIDQDVVSSHLPRFAREDFLVTVFRGAELDPFSDGPEDEEDEDEEEE